MEQKVLTTKELRLRITDLEYEDLTPEEHIKEIQRIYIEEMGEPLPAEIKIYPSSQSNIIDDDSEFSGSAIRFYSEENGIDEVYFVTQGTQGPEDWIYNIKAMVAGLAHEQIDDVNTFIKDALNHFEYEYDSNKGHYDIPIIGLGHSQAHNTNASALLIHGIFTNVYSANGAQLNVYQLYHADERFQEYLSGKYQTLSIEKRNIYNLDLDELKQHAIHFYGDKADQIFQDVSIQDPLYGLSEYQGFFLLGDMEKHITNENLPGISELFDKVPDNYLKQLQNIAIVYTLGSEQGDNVQVLNELLGADVSILFDFKLKYYVTRNFEIYQTVRNLDANLPNVLDTIYEITNHRDSILTELTDAGYLTLDQKEVLVDTLKNIEEDLIEIQKTISNMAVVRDPTGPGGFISEVWVDIASYVKLQNLADSLQEQFENFPLEEFEEALEQIGRSHGIEELLDAMSDDDRMYMDSEMYVKGNHDGEEIWVSLTATGKICSIGKMNLAEKEEMVETLQNAFEEKVYDAFEEQRLRARVAVDYMEQNPNEDRAFLHPHGFDEGMNRTITRIDVHEDIPRFEDTTLDMTHQIDKLNTSIEKGYLLIEEYRETIEQLFDAEMNIAEQIDFLEEVYNGS